KAPERGQQRAPLWNPAAKGNRTAPPGAPPPATHPKNCSRPPQDCACTFASRAGLTASRAALFDRISRMKTKAAVCREEGFPPDRLSPLHDGKGKPIVHGLRTGAFAEHMVVDQSQAVPIPKEIPLDSAALIACGVLTGMGAVV